MFLKSLVYYHFLTHSPLAARGFCILFLNYRRARTQLAPIHFSPDIIPQYWPPGAVCLTAAKRPPPLVFGDHFRSWVVRGQDSCFGLATGFPHARGSPPPFLARRGPPAPSGWPSGSARRPSAWTAGSASPTSGPPDPFIATHPPASLNPGPSPSPPFPGVRGPCRPRGGVPSYPPIGRRQTGDSSASSARRTSAPPPWTRSHVSRPSACCQNMPTADCGFKFKFLSNVHTNNSEHRHLEYRLSFVTRVLPPRCRGRM